MAVTEKLANLRKRAFARFKSHSYNIPSSSDTLPPSSITMSDNETNIPMLQENVKNRNIQHDLTFRDCSSTWRNSGQVTKSFRVIDNRM